MDIQTEKAILKSLALPKRDITDGFGIYRDWGFIDPATKRFGWTTATAYRPVHYGIDYRAEPDTVQAPGDGFVWYEPDYDMIHFVPRKDKRRSTEIAVFLLHTVAHTPLDVWQPVVKGDVIGTHVDMPGKHLHFEVAISPALYAEIRLRQDITIDSDYIKYRCEMRGMDINAVLERVYAQRDADGIAAIRAFSIYRLALPEYKQSVHTPLGKGETVIIDLSRIRG